MAHRVAFLVMRGRWPANEVDHIDGNRANNRFANLREATAAENQRNAKLRKDNRVGLKGVKKNGSGYAAWIRLNNRPKYIGTFKTPEAAHKAYITVAETSYGDFARAA
jgi:antibiotic biosynthesis monooxygenase (ABM) superfamily enzyme